QRDFLVEGGGPHGQTHAGEPEEREQHGDQHHGGAEHDQEAFLYLDTEQRHLVEAPWGPDLPHVQSDVAVDDDPDHDVHAQRDDRDDEDRLADHRPDHGALDADREQRHQQHGHDHREVEVHVTDEVGHQ